MTLFYTQKLAQFIIAIIKRKEKKMCQFVEISTVSCGNGFNPELICHCSITQRMLYRLDKWRSSDFFFMFVDFFFLQMKKTRSITILMFKTVNVSIHSFRHHSTQSKLHLICVNYALLKLVTISFRQSSLSLSFKFSCLDYSIFLFTLSIFPIESDDDRCGYIFTPIYLIFTTFSLFYSSLIPIRYIDRLQKTYLNMSEDE